MKKDAKTKMSHFYFFRLNIFLSLINANFNNCFIKLFSKKRSKTINNTKYTCSSLLVSVLELMLR